MTKVAIITPVFNGEKYLSECIASVAGCNIENFELEHILVDDASTDSSWSVIQKSKSPFIKSFQLKINGGGSAARNFAIQQSAADYIFCLDQDDVIFQNSLNSLVTQQSDWVYGDFLRTDKNLAYQINNDYYGYNFKSPQELLKSIFGAEHFFQQNCFYKKSIFDESGGFDPKEVVYQDLDLFIRFLLNGHLPKYLPGPLYLHRMHENNLSKITGREDNLEAHKKDLQSLYLKYQIQLKKASIPDPSYS